MLLCQRWSAGTRDRSLVEKQSTVFCGAKTVRLPGMLDHNFCTATSDLLKRHSALLPGVQRGQGLVFRKRRLTCVCFGHNFFPETKIPETNVDKSVPADTLLRLSLNVNGVLEKAAIRESLEKNCFEGRP